MAFAPVQAVTKALTVLEMVNRSGLTSVKELHQKTGIPKPTIVRLLQTLQFAGYIVQDEKSYGYRVTSAVNNLSSGYHGAPFVIELARPFADELTRKIIWPCAICTLDLDAVVVNYSTIPDSPISPFHASLGRRLSLGGRALGRAYVCFCPPDEQRILRNVMRASADPENNKMDDDTFERMVAQARSDGFTERSPSLEPRTSGTIALPILLRGRVLATFGVTYFRSAVSKAQSRNDVLEHVRETVANIESALEAPWNT